MKSMRLALAIVLAALIVVPLLPSVKAPPLAPYEAWGIARNAAGSPLALGTPIRTFIDGVDYSNLTATYRPDGSYQTSIAGNWYIGASKENPAIKQGGDPNDAVMFADGDLATGGNVMQQNATWQSAAFQNLNLQEASAQPALIKICTITTRPADTLSQYSYLYNPTGAAVDLSNYYVQTDARGSYTGPTVSLSGTVPAGSEVFADFFSTTYLANTGDALKLVYRNPGGANAAFNGRDVVVDRVEFNATTGGSLYWWPGNTVMSDAVAPGLGQEIRRNPTCGTDTNQGSDFVLGPETGRPTAPSVTVSAPNGGERWTGASQHYIYWNMTDAQSANTALTVRLNYSIDSGTTWSTIASGRPGTVNPNRYLWTVPRIDTNHARVQVCATDPTALTGCDESNADFSIDSTAPRVLSTTPGSGATGVGANQPIIIQFSESMNTASVEPAFSITGVTPLTYTWSATGFANDTVTITHTPFALGQNYNPSVGTLAKDSSDPGNYLIPAYSWNFQTLINSAPTAAVTSPAGGVRWSGGFTHRISWTMSDDRTPANQLVVYVNYTSVMAGNGAIAGPLTGNLFYDWTPVAIDANDVKIHLTVFDADGASMPVDSGTFTIDSTPPSVTSTTPANNAPAVLLTSSIVIQFSEAIDETSFPSTFQVSPAVANPVFNWAVTRDSVTINHDPFFGSTPYTVRITGAKDTSSPGVVMPTPYTFSFTTVAPQRPTVAVSAPAAGASFAPGASITITWTMSDPVTATANLVVYVNYTSSAGNGAVSGRLVGQQTYTWTAPSISATDVVVHVTVINEAALSAEAGSGAFTIQSPGGPIDVVTLGIIAIVIIVIIAVLVLFLLSKRRKKETEEEEGPKAKEPEAAPAAAERVPPPPPPAAPVRGAPLAAAATAGTKECPSCGTILDTKDAECFMCGHKF
jgi:hypothetical protein